MEGFILPTQLALLVYGYLVEEGCSSAAKSFMETSQYTKDAREYVAKGQRFTCKLHGLSLTDIIGILGEVVCYVNSLECAQPITLEETLRQLRYILRLSSDERNVEKPVYLRFTMQQTPGKKSPRKNKPLETNSTPKSSKSSPVTTSPRLDGSAVIPSTSKVQQQFHVLLENKVLHEKLAENINRVVANKSDVESLESVLQKKIVETIYNDTEQDPFFQEMLEELVGPVEASSTPEDTEHENDDVGTNNFYAPIGGFVENQTPCQEPAVQTDTVGQSSHLASLQSVQTPSARNVVDKASDKSGVSFELSPLPPACGPVEIQPIPLAPLVATQPGMQPLDVQTVMATSLCIPVTTQSSPAYVIASSPGTALLSSLVTPSVVIGTTFSGAAVKFTPTGPTVSRIRQVAPPGHSAAPSPQMLSSIKVLANTTRASSLPLVLPKPPPPPFPGGVLGQPIFRVPVTHQGNLQSAPSLLQNPVATVSLAPSTTPNVSKPVPSTAVKIGARTRGGKVKSYAGRKKVVQTIGPSTATSPDGPGFSKMRPVSESRVDVVESGGNSESPVKKSQEESVGTASDGALTDSEVVAGPSINDEAEKPISEPVAGVPDSVVETAKPDVEVAKSDVEIPKPVAEIAQPDEEIPKANVEVAEFENEVTKSDAELLTGSTEQSSSQEKVNPVVSLSEADTVERSSSTNAIPCRTDATPQQGSEPRVKLRKRLSLSTPRRGSHVRTLEFKTPPKNSNKPRKSLSSPKNRGPETVRPEMQKMLESVKKSQLFKSPVKKEKKAWDADLREYTTEEDIPTSVGLKRKCSTASKSGSTSKSKGSKNTSKHASCDPKSAGDTSTTVVDVAKTDEKSAEKVGTVPKTPERKPESDEDLVSRIQREVLDVIDEEDVADLGSTSFCVNKSGESGESPKSSPKLVKSPIRSPGTSSVLEIGDIGLSASTIKKLYRRTTSIDESSCTMDSPLSKAPKDNLLSSPKRSQIEASKEHLFASPVRSAVECAKTSSVYLELQLSPSPQQLKADLGSTPPRNVGIFSGQSRTPGSGSLEATLIRECRRIENEGVETACESSNEKSPNCVSPKVLGKPDANPLSVISIDVEAKTVAQKPENSVIPWNHLLPPIGITPLKTPGKTLLSAPVGITPLKTPWKPLPTAPVEMTPLSKIINEETRLGKCILLTPTIPPTPDYEELKNQAQPPGDANSSPSAFNISQKTPQSKTPTSSEAPVKTPSPSKKLKTPSSTPSKTPVVKLKAKPAKSTAKTRKRKPAKGSKQTDIDTDKLIAQCLETAKEAMYGSKKNTDGNITCEPVKEEVPQKKTPKRKRKVPQKSETKEKKESQTDNKLPSFEEILERYEKSIIGSSSTEDDSVFTSAHPKPQCIPTKASKTPKKKSVDTKKVPKKRSPKEKVTTKKTETKTKNKKVRGKKIHQEEITEGTTENDAAGEKDSEKCSTTEKGAVSTPDPCKDSETAMANSVLSTRTADVGSKIDSGVSKNLASSVGTKGQRNNVSSTTTWVSENSQDYISIRSLKESKLDQELTKNVAISSDSVRMTELPGQESAPPQAGHTILPASQSVPASLIEVPSTLHCSPPVRNSSNIHPDQLLEPSLLAVEGDPSSTLKKPTKRVDLENYAMEITVKMDNIPSRRKIIASPFFALHEYPLPPSSPLRTPLSPGNSSGDYGSEIEEVGEGSQRKRRISSCRSSKEEKQSQKPVKHSNDSSNKVEEFAESTRRTQRRSRSNSSSRADRLSPVMFSNASTSRVGQVEETSKRRRGRSRNSGSSEDDKPRRKPGRPVKSSNVIKAEEVGESTKRRRRRSKSSSSSEDEKSSQKPGRHVKSFNVSHNKPEEIKDTSKRRRRGSRGSSSSEDDKSPRKPGRHMKASNASHIKAEEVKETSKRRRRRSRSSSSSEEVRSSRKRRRTDEWRDHIWPRRTPGKFRGRFGRNGGQGYPLPPRVRSRSWYEHRRSHRYSSSDDGRGRKKSHPKLLPSSGSRDRERDRSRSHSRDGEERQPKKDDSKKHRDDSKKRQDESKSHSADRKKHHDDKKHHSDSSHCDDTSKSRYEPTKDKDSRRSDRRETTCKPTSSQQDRHSSSIEEQAPTGGRTETSGNNTNELPRKPSRKPLAELEEGEISEESRNTIFQFSMNNPRSATDRLSSPVASESRQKLLKNVNVDKFLSLLHGDAKSPLTKEEEEEQPSTLPNPEKLS